MNFWEMRTYVTFTAYFTFPIIPVGEISTVFGSEAREY